MGVVWESYGDPGSQYVAKLRFHFILGHTDYIIVRRSMYFNKSKGVKNCRLTF